MLPFDETILSKNIVIRVFNANTTAEDMLWHRDKEDRLIEIIKPGNWWIQLDNELPKKLKKNKKYFIKSNTWHRVVSGNEDLIIKIYKLY